LKGTPLELLGIALRTCTEDLVDASLSRLGPEFDASDSIIDWPLVLAHIVRLLGESLLIVIITADGHNDVVLCTGYLRLVRGSTHHLLRWRVRGWGIKWRLSHTINVSYTHDVSWGSTREGVLLGTCDVLKRDSER